MIFDRNRKEVWWFRANIRLSLFKLLWSRLSKGGMNAVLKVLGFFLGLGCFIFGGVGTVVGLSDEPGMGIVLIFAVPIAVFGVFLLWLSVRRGKVPAEPPPLPSAGSVNGAPRHSGN